ncbi:MAG: IMP dehydrogenase, partial [Candidatus Accumulibacter phosphatis]
MKKTVMALMVWMLGMAMTVSGQGARGIIRFCDLGSKAMRLIQKALTFDDVLLVPAHSSIMPRDVTLRARLTRNISLNLPL